MRCLNWELRMRWEKRVPRVVRGPWGRRRRKCPELGSRALRASLCLVGWRAGMAGGMGVGHRA